MYNISEFAKLLNVTSQTLRNWDKNGKLKPITLQSGHRRYTDQHLKIIKGIKSQDRLNIIYCRQSTKQQKNSLQQQQNRTKQFCINSGIKIDKVISEYGSALNYNRKGLQQLIKLINDNLVETLVIYYKDRLVRFGFEFFEQLSRQNNFKLLIIDNSQSNKSKDVEFAEDLISIIHYFSMKLYGSRNYKNKIKPAEDNIRQILNQG